MTNNKIKKDMREETDHRLRMLSIVRSTDGFGWGINGETFD